MNSNNKNNEGEDNKKPTFLEKNVWKFKIVSNNQNKEGKDEKFTNEDKKLFTYMIVFVLAGMFTVCWVIFIVGQSVNTVLSEKELDNLNGQVYSVEEMYRNMTPAEQDWFRKFIQEKKYEEMYEVFGKVYGRDDLLIRLKNLSAE